MRASREPLTNQHGGALLTVLWLSAALSAIAFTVATRVRSETDHVANSADGLRAWYLATGAVERGIQWMMWGWTSQYNNSDGSSKYWAPNMPRMNMSFPSGDAVVEMIPESSKLNVNTASPDDLQRLITVISGDPARAREIAAAVVDWRSPPQDSDFDSFYLSLDSPFHARHASFQEIEELMLVKGITAELFYGNYVPDSNGRLYASGGLRDCLSVWGGNGPFDINSVSPALMRALGVSPEVAQAVVARRQAGPFKNIAEARDLGADSGRLGIGGNYIWTLRATARLRRQDGSPSDVVRTAAAVVKLVDARQYYMEPVHVLRWYDDAWSQSAIAPPGAVHP
ncbi:MAG: general secretion pathway protein GspK [Bryobacteraceae bacterium]